MYGYSISIGPDGKPKVREFGNVKTFGKRNLNPPGRNLENPKITAAREPLTDINTTDNEVRIILELHGVKKEDIKINANENVVEIRTNDPIRKYYKTLELPSDADINAVKSTYNNGIVEVTFAKVETNQKVRKLR